MCVKLIVTLLVTGLHMIHGGGLSMSGSDECCALRLQKDHERLEPIACDVESAWTSML